LPQPKLIPRDDHIAGVEQLKEHSMSEKLLSLLGWGAIAVLVVSVIGFSTTYRDTYRARPYIFHSDADSFQKSLRENQLGLSPELMDKIVREENEKRENPKKTIYVDEKGRIVQVK
jgi:hypothetical protein